MGEGWAAGGKEVGDLPPNSQIDRAASSHSQQVHSLPTPAPMCQLACSTPSSPSPVLLSGLRGGAGVKDRSRATRRCALGSTRLLLPTPLAGVAPLPLPGVPPAPRAAVSSSMRCRLPAARAVMGAGVAAAGVPLGRSMSGGRAGSAATTGAGGVRCGTVQPQPCCCWFSCGSGAAQAGCWVAGAGASAARLLRPQVGGAMPGSSVAASSEESAPRPAPLEFTRAAASMAAACSAATTCSRLGGLRRLAPAAGSMSNSGSWGRHSAQHGPGMAGRGRAG